MDMLISKGCNVHAKNKVVISGVNLSFFTKIFAGGSRRVGNSLF